MFTWFQVQLRTEENNRRSGKAVEKIDGRFEGMLQNDVFCNDSSKENPT